MRWNDTEGLPENIKRQIEEKMGKPKKKKSKYNNRRTWAKGLAFDSQKEADYYCELDILLKAGKIKGFCRQPRFPLIEGDRATEYVADFIVWENDGRVRIIDVKSEPTKTQAYKLKKKMLKSKHGLSIEEIV